MLKAGLIYYWGKKNRIQKVICQLINTVALILTFIPTPTCLVKTVALLDIVGAQDKILEY